MPNGILIEYSENTRRYPTVIRLLGRARTDLFHHRFACRQFCYIRVSLLLNADEVLPTHTRLQSGLRSDSQKLWIPNAYDLKLLIQIFFERNCCAAQDRDSQFVHIPQSPANLVLWTQSRFVSVLLPLNSSVVCAQIRSSCDLSAGT